MASDDLITINRAPVLTIWATVVARRSGFRKAEALTLGKAVAGLNSQSKGRRLGIYRGSLSLSLGLFHSSLFIVLFQPQLHDSTNQVAGNRLIQGKLKAALESGIPDDLLLQRFIA